MSNAEEKLKDALSRFEGRVVDEISTGEIKEVLRDVIRGFVPEVLDVNGGGREISAEVVDANIDAGEVVLAVREAVEEEPEVVDGAVSFQGDDRIIVGTVETTEEPTLQTELIRLLSEEYDDSTVCEGLIPIIEDLVRLIWARDTVGLNTMAKGFLAALMWTRGKRETPRRMLKTGRYSAINLIAQVAESVAVREVIIQERTGNN